MRTTTFNLPTARELLLAIAVVAVFVGAFVNCQAVRNALSATKPISTSLPAPEE